MEWLLEVEGGILLWIQEVLRADWLTPLVRAVTFLGNGGWFWIAAALILCCWRRSSPCPGSIWGSTSPAMCWRGR